MTQTPGPTEVICENVRNLRRQRGWSARELADRCRAAGLAKWNREIVANIENGRRSSISIEELFVLAIVFGIAPVALCVPLRAAEYAPTPQITVHPWRAAQWIAGSATAPLGATEPTSDQLDRWAGAVLPIQLFQSAENALKELRDAEQRCTIFRLLVQQLEDELSPDLISAVRDGSIPALLSGAEREKAELLRESNRDLAEARIALDDARQHLAETVRHLLLSGLSVPEDLATITSSPAINGLLIRAPRAERERDTDGEGADS